MVFRMESIQGTFSNLAKRAVLCAVPSVKMLAEKVIEEHDKDGVAREVVRILNG